MPQSASILSYMNAVAKDVGELADILKARIKDERINILEQGRLRVIILFDGEIQSDYTARTLIDYALKRSPENETIVLGAGIVPADPFVFAHKRFLSSGASLNAFRIPDEKKLYDLSSSLPDDREVLRELFGEEWADQVLLDGSGDASGQIADEEIDQLKRLWTRIYQIVGGNNHQLMTLLRDPKNGIPGSDEVWTLLDLPSDFIQQNNLAVYGDLATLLEQQIGPQAMAQLPDSFKQALKQASNQKMPPVRRGLN